jgi:hypothetical protein
MKKRNQRYLEHFRRKLLLLLCLMAFGHVYSQQIFDASQLHEIAIFTEDQQWSDSLQLWYDNALDGADHRFERSMAIIDGDTIYGTGLRFKGKYSNYGFPGPKKPFRLDFNEFADGQQYQGLKKINLHNLAGDPSFLREFMAYDLLRTLGVAVPRTSFARLTINGVYWGCYQIVEEPDKKFLQHHFGSSGGSLFEAVKTTSLGWKGSDPALYSELELKTDPQAGSWDNLLSWIDLFNNYRSFDFHQRLGEVFDTEAFIRSMAVDALINNGDAYATNGRNFFIYDDPNGKLTWIPWDYNLSFWVEPNYPIPVVSGTNYQPLVYRFVDCDHLKKEYLARICSLLDNELSVYPFEARSAAMHQLIAQAVEEDTLKFYTTEQFYANRTSGLVVNMLRNNAPKDVYLPGLTDLFARRKTEMRKALYASGCDCDNLQRETDLTGSVFPNPASENITVFINEALTDELVYLSISDLRGRTVADSYSYAEHGSFPVSVSQLAPGAYVVRIAAAGRSFTGKFIRQ